MCNPLLRTFEDLELHDYQTVLNQGVKIEKNTILRFCSTNKGSNWSVETNNCKGTFKSLSQAASYFIRK